jgi:hypothetical protein
MPSEESNRIRVIREKPALNLQVTRMPYVVHIQKSYQIPSGLRAQSITRRGDTPIFLLK